MALRKRGNLVFARPFPYRDFAGRYAEMGFDNGKSRLATARAMEAELTAKTAQQDFTNRRRRILSNWELTPDLAFDYLQR